MHKFALILRILIIEIIVFEFQLPFSKRVREMKDSIDHKMARCRQFICNKRLELHRILKVALIFNHAEYIKPQNE